MSEPHETDPDYDDYDYYDESYDIREESDFDHLYNEHGESGA